MHDKTLGWGIQIQAGKVLLLHTEPQPLGKITFAPSKHIFTLFLYTDFTFYFLNKRPVHMKQWFISGSSSVLAVILLSFLPFPWNSCLRVTNPYLPLNTMTFQGLYLLDDLPLFLKPLCVASMLVFFAIIFSSPLPTIICAVVVLKSTFLE